MTFKFSLLLRKIFEKKAKNEKKKLPGMYLQYYKLPYDAYLDLFAVLLFQDVKVFIHGIFILV